jgi:hypothetical protein
MQNEKLKMQNGKQRADFSSSLFAFLIFHFALFHAL